jgi:hypothetical protein
MNIGQYLPKPLVEIKIFKLQICFVETKGRRSCLLKKYGLSCGFTNYLLDDTRNNYSQKYFCYRTSNYLNENKFLIIKSLDINHPLLEWRKWG